MESYKNRRFLNFRFLNIFENESFIKEISILVCNSVSIWSLIKISILINIKISIKLTEIRRKLYKRGSSFETTIPMPLLFSIDKLKKHNVVFKFDEKSNKWYVEFEEMEK